MLVIMVYVTVEFGYLVIACETELYLLSVHKVTSTFL